MPSRIPLIVNVTANQIQELPVGDGLTGINSLTVGAVAINTTTVSQPFQVGSGSTVVFVDSQGDLGIGTTAATSKLTVVGDGVFSGVITATSFTGTFIGTATQVLNVNLVAGNADGNYIVFAQAQTGTIPLRTNASLTYNVSTNTIVANISGNAATATNATNATNATQWSTGRTISLTGDVTGTSGSFNGTANLSFATTLANSSVSAAKLNGAQGGSAPIYGARAWVNFDGKSSSPSTIRGSGNITSVTKNGTGDYTINFSTAMSDANYSAVVSVDDDAHPTDGTSSSDIVNLRSLASGSVRVITSYSNPGQYRLAADYSFVTACIFR